MTITFHRNRGITHERQQLLKQWQRMSNRERESWGYTFDNYAEAQLYAKTSNKA